MVAAIEGDIDFELVFQSGAAARLDGFSAGKKRYGKLVNEMVARLCVRPWWTGLTVLAMKHDDQLAGVCAWYPRPLPSPGSPLPDDVYIHTIGLSEPFQGRALGDGMWLSNALLRGALRQINAETAAGRMPASWTYVAPFNKKSHRLFAEHGYATRAPLPKNDMIRFRPPGLDPDLYLSS
jgi:hypothetical protein